MHVLGHLPAAKDDLLGLFDRARDTGPVVDLRMFVKTTTVISTPEAARHVLVTNAANYDKSTRGYAVLRLLMGKGLVTSDGDLWRRQRRIANPAFHRTAVAGFVDTMQSYTTRWLDTLPSGAARVDITRAMHELTLDIAGRTLMGLDLSQDRETVGKALDIVLPGFNELTRSILPRPWRWPLPKTRRFMGGVQMLDTLVRELIAARRADPVDHPDLLGMLMCATDPESGEAMSDEQLRDEVLTMLLAGHETTANAMSWTLYLLAQHPDIADGIRDEVARVVGDGPVTAAHIGQLDLTGRTFDESLRLYPPIWVTGRNALEDDVIEGVPVPKGRLVFIHTWGMHRHPDLWDRPLVFDPDRFLPEAKARIPRGAYHPFTMGHRKCIGDRFARTEGIALLATILRRIDVALDPGQTAVPEPTLTLRPRGGLHMTVAPRPRGL